MNYKNFAIQWNTSTSGVTGVLFRCGFCGADAGVTTQLVGVLAQRNGPSTGRIAHIYFCPVCSQPSYCDPQTDEFTPAAPLGADLKSLPAGIADLYKEARDCSGVGAYTACAMACRKILMNLAVLEKAKPGLSFVDYVDYLTANGFVPPKGKAWVDRIRAKGNEANHEIKPMQQKDAEEIMMLTEMLLRFNFELGSPPADGSH